MTENGPAYVLKYPRQNAANCGKYALLRKGAPNCIVSYLFATAGDQKTRLECHFEGKTRQIAAKDKISTTVSLRMRRVRGSDVGENVNFTST